jgi:hypothetical protein
VMDMCRLRLEVARKIAQPKHKKPPTLFNNSTCERVGKAAAFESSRTRPG